jgi:hypothetical protein
VRASEVLQVQLTVRGSCPLCSGHNLSLVHYVPDLCSLEARLWARSRDRQHSEQWADHVVRANQAIAGPHWGIDLGGCLCDHRLLHLKARQGHQCLVLAPKGGLCFDGVEVLWLHVNAMLLSVRHGVLGCRAYEACDLQL